MKNIITPSFMIIPSMACQASCKYCFGPNEGEIINEKTAQQVIRFVSSIVNETSQKKVSITFHGGEPLIAPYSIWEILLTGLSDKLIGLETKLSIQSNLWKLDDKFSKLFGKFNVSIGTSLDGDKILCDRTRGNNYFENTFQGIKKAREHGLDVGAIATICKSSLSNWKGIIDFYIRNGISLNIHAALPILKNKSNENNYLTKEEYEKLIIDMYEYYIINRKSISISTLDNYVKGIVNRDPEVCSYGVPQKLDKKIG
jgi:uncharacterized protein